MRTLANCPRCGKLFVKEGVNFCPSCIQDIENEYTRCIEYLREHKFVSLYELSEATDVTVRQITQFIREGRISIADNPNMAYTCESCGTPIREGRLCKKCSERLNKGIKEQLQHKTVAEEEERQTKGYYQIGEKLKKDN